jgi:hypothetical protein
MTIYDDLRQQYDKWSKESRDYWFNSGQYASRFARGFREYLAAPEYFKGEATRHRYVDACKVIEDESTGELNLKPADFHDILTRGEDGYLTFGVSVVLEKAPDTFPKASFWFSIDMLPRDGKCTMKITGEPFELDMSDDQTRTPAYEHMVKVLREWLASKPWDVDRKNPIGFVQHSA